MPKLNWEETCSKCIYGSIESLRTNAKGRCTYKTPNVLYGIAGWECNTFVRRWDTKEDLDKAKQEKEENK
jgi:hypothetical protein